MAEHGAPHVPPGRAELEKLMAVDLRAMTARSDRVGRYFARRHDLHSSDLHALLHIMVAETAGEPLNSTQLRERMDISNAAITYLVDRVTSAGHIRREADPSDRRKSLLRLESNAMALGREFFGPLGTHIALRGRRSVRRRPAGRPPSIDGDDHRDVGFRGRVAHGVCGIRKGRPPR